MALLDNRVLDLGLNVLDTEATHIHLMGSQPANYAAVTSGTLGSAPVNIGAPTNRAGGGREVTIAAVTNGTISAATPTAATHYAIVDQTNGRLLVSNNLTASQTVTSGNTFSLAAFTVGIPTVA